MNDDADRNRIAAILRSPTAARCRTLAQHVALETDISQAFAEEMLAAFEADLKARLQALNGSASDGESHHAIH